MTLLCESIQCTTIETRAQPRSLSLFGHQIQLIVAHWVTTQVLAAPAPEDLLTAVAECLTN